MPDYVIYILIGIVLIIVLFLLLRTTLQLIFIKQCPKCKKTVSLLKTKICPKCGYDFNERKDPKFHATVTLLIIAVLGIGAFDVYSFMNHTKQYTQDNPYVSVPGITKKDVEEAQTEETAGTEMPAEDPAEVPADAPVDGEQDQAVVQ